jgi:replicative DNA helicase
MGGKSKDGRYGLITEISRGLKEIAKSEGVAVLALSQLSRDVEKREDKRPTLSDLRESGQIEQDADTVLFLYRPQYYLELAEPPVGSEKRAAWEQALEGCRDQIEFIVAKRRNGRTGSRTGQFHGQFMAVRG